MKSVKGFLSYGVIKESRDLFIYTKILKGIGRERRKM